MATEILSTISVASSAPQEAIVCIFTFTLSALVFTSVLTQCFKGKSRPHDANSPPGPTPIPILGNLLSIGSSPHIAFQTMAEKYGPVMMLYLGRTPAVILSDPEVFKEAMVSKGTLTAGRPETPTSRVVTDGGKDIAYGDYGASWRRLRKAVVMDLLHKSAYSKHSSLIANELMKVKEAIENSCRAGGGEALLDLRSYIRAMTLNSIYSVVFGRTLDPGNPGHDPDMYELDRSFMAVIEELGVGAIEDFVPLLHMLPTPHMTKVWLAVKTRDRIMAKFIKERISAPTNAPPLLLDLLLAKREERAMTERDIFFCVADLIAAGTDTSGHTLEYLLLLMAANPASQDAVQAELDGVFGKEAPKTVDITKLPILQAALLETMRIRPVAPLHVPHKATCDLTVGGYHVPAGTQIIVNNWALMSSPKLWVRPEEFRMHRFLEEEKHLTLRNFDAEAGMDAYKFVPFGAGPRQCPGREMAMHEMVLFAAHLLHAFRWTPQETCKINLEGKFGLTLEPHMQHLKCSLRHAR